MASHKRPYDFDMHHESTSQYESPLLHPYELYQDSTTGRRLPKRHQMSQLRFRPNLEVNLDSVAGLTVAGDSIFQSILASNPGGGKANFTNERFHPWTYLEHSKSQGDVKKTLPKDELWRQMFEEPPPAEVPASPEFRWNSLQSNSDFLLHINALANPGNHNVDSYPDSLLDMEESCPRVGELGCVNAFGGNSVLLDQAFPGSSWADRLSLDTSRDKSYKTSKLLFSG